MEEDDGGPEFDIGIIEFCHVFTRRRRSSLLAEWAALGRPLATRRPWQCVLPDIAGVEMKAVGKFLLGLLARCSA